MSTPDDDFSLPISLGRLMEMTEGGVYVPTRERIYYPSGFLNTHLHLQGQTGSGKTNGLVGLVTGLVMDDNPRQSIVCIDALGGWSQTLLRLLAHPDYCNDAIRDRFVYFEPSYEQIATTINPLRHDSRQHLDYQLVRAMSLILRGFASADLDAMPRLRLWLHKVLAGLAGAGYPLAIGKFLLNPRLEEHECLIRQLPASERAEWQWLIKEGRGEAHRVLESTRNRMGLFSGESIVLQRLFGSTENRFDMAELMESGKIVLINLSPGAQRLDLQAATTIGSLLIYEVFSHGMTRLASSNRHNETVLIIDEFHRFLGGAGGGDIIEYLPIIRNMGVRLVCANQSYAQLVTPELDLRPLVAQFRSRMMFSNEYSDANLLAEELARRSWDPDQVKRQYYGRRQRIAGHRKEILESWGETSSTQDGWSNQNSRSSGESVPKGPSGDGSTNTGQGVSDSFSGSKTESHSHNWHEQLVPVHEDFEELVKEDFVSFEEEMHRWGKVVRQLRTGQTIAQFVNDPQLYPVLVDYLPLDEDDPDLDRRVEELKAKNYEQPYFVSADEADRELESHRQRLLRGERIEIRQGRSSGMDSPTDPAIGRRDDQDRVETEDGFCD